MSSISKTSSQKRIIISFLLIFIVSVFIICALMYQVFRNNLHEGLHARALEVIDIIDYMTQTSGESPELVRGIKTLAANRDIKLIIIRINEPPVVIASNKEALIGLPSNEIFNDYDSNQIFRLNSNTDEYTAISSLWLENKFSGGNFTKASIGIIFDTYKARILLQKKILNTSIFLILTTIFAIGIIYLLTRKYIFKPLEIINTTLSKNNSNNEFQPIPYTQEDEIGTVANTLNNLFSDLYKSKKSLRENKERYDLALQGTKVGLLDWDIESNELFCSSTLIELLGYDKNEIIPSIDWFESIAHEDDREHAKSALISHLKLNTEYDIEGRICRKSGEYIWMRVRGQALRNHENKAVRMVGYYVDISKRKEHESFMNSLYMLSADANLPLDLKISKILDKGAHYLGIDCGVICKIDGENSFVTYSHCPDKYKINDQTTYKLSETFCSQTYSNNDMVDIHNISTSKLNHLPEHKTLGINCYIGTPLYIHGRIYGTVSFSDFRSKLKPFSEQEKSFVRLLAQWISNEMMRAQYIEYLHETESRLEDAVEELTKTNTELENFTYVASHDLQEPLRMITNFTGILENNYKDQLDETAKEYLRISSSSAEQMRVLIKDLLEYAHASKENEKYETIELNDIINHVYVNLEKQIEETSAQIVCENLPSIEANKASMISLLQNLIGNGIKFQQKGNKPIIGIKSIQQGDYWVVSIRDNGIGIPNIYHNKVFEPFKRLHSKSEYIGTGIGLAVCKKIVERLNGTLWVESNPNLGCTFSFTVPIKITQTGKAA